MGEARVLSTRPTSPADDATIIPSVDAGVLTRLDIPAIVRKRTHIKLAGSDSYNKAFADHVCNGSADDADLANAISDLSSNPGATIEIMDGHYDWADEVACTRNDIEVFGHGASGRVNGDGTVIVPNAAFPNEKFALKFEYTGSEPAHGVYLHDFMVANGVGATNNVYANTVNGIDICGYRCYLERVHVMGMSGDGLKLRHLGGWGGYENVYDKLLLYGNGRYGMRVNNAVDSHWSNLVVASSGVANLYGEGGVTHILCQNSHFYSGAQNPTGAQTVKNVHLAGGAGGNTKFVGCSFQHAAQYVMHLDATTAGGQLQFSACDWRGGSGEAVNTYSTMRVTSVGGNYYQLLIDGGHFKADLSTPKYFLEFAGNIDHSRINAYFTLGQTGTGLHTALNGTNGDLATINGLGHNGNNDPNSAGAWLNKGTMGLKVIGDSGKIYLCTATPSTWVALT